MRGVKPPSRAAVRRGVESQLRALLRSPKTLQGLVAVASASGLSKRFVLGWLTAKIKSAQVAELKSSEAVLYQLGECVLEEKPKPSIYPTWLEPRGLPTSTSRQVFVQCRPVLPNQKEDP